MDNQTEAKQLLDAFMVKGREFIQRYPDFNDSLHAAEAQGLKLDAPALKEIIRMGRPDVAYFLTQNPAIAHDLMGKSESRVKDRLQRIATDIDLKGNYKAAVVKRNETDEYLERRGAFRRRK